MSCAAWRKSAAPSTLSKLRAQAVDHLIGRGGALIARLEVEVETPVIEGAAASRADRIGEAGNVGILGDDGGELLLQPRHLGEGDVLGGLRAAGD
jgi:hypothetical protein